MMATQVYLTFNNLTVCLKTPYYFCTNTHTSFKLPGHMQISNKFTKPQNTFREVCCTIGFVLKSKHASDE